MVFILLYLMSLTCFTLSDRQTVQYMDLDILSPFTSNLDVNTHRKNRFSHKFYEVAHNRNASSGHSVHHFIRNIGNTTVIGHRVLITNGRELLSVLEPLENGGCNNRQRATVMESAKQRECLVSVNAGFFDEKTGQCYGNVVSDGEQVNQFRGLKSANFGIRKDGSLVVGYLKESEILTMKEPLQQLVSGVGWILRNRESYLQESMKHEQCNLENLKEFFNVKSSRTMIGHDDNGNIHIVQVDGKTGRRGINLYEAVDLLISFGLVNAINLNGGGASTFVVDQTLVNYPSNTCSNLKGEQSLCPMEVSSILCIHQPDRCNDVQSCSGHGRCRKGKCKCSDGWAGKDCRFSTDGHLTYCCWRNYYLVIVLSTIIAISIIGNIFLCDLVLLYRFRSKDLAQPKRRQKDRLRMYLKQNSVLMSSNDDISSEQSLK